MIRKNKNSLNVIISSLGVAAGTLPAAGTVVTAANLPKGAAVLVDKGMRLLVAADLKANGGTVSRVKIAQSLGAGKPLVITHDFDIEKSKVSFSKHTPAKEQITAIGYNPVIGGGALPSGSDTHYFISIDQLDNDAIHRDNYDSIMFDASTNIAGDQGLLATDLAGNAAQNISKFAEKMKYMKAYAVVDAPNAAGLGTGDVELDSAVITNAAALITALPSGTDSILSVPTTIVVNGATVNINRVYGIKSVDTLSNTITLQQPIQEPTTAGLTFDDGAGTDFGIVLEMTRNEFDNYALRDYYKNRITVRFSETFTPITELQSASEGQGVGEKALFDEFIGMGIEGQKAIYHAPAIRREQEAKLDSKYGVININYSETIHELLNVDGAQGNVLVYVELDGTGATAVASAGDSATLLADNVFLGNAVTTGVNTSADLNE